MFPVVHPGDPSSAKTTGEPDVEIKKAKNGQVVIEIKGVDVYDPTTGQIRSASTDDIACWFIDTDYNGESFFVRHAYHTGAERDGNGPYDKLKRAPRTEIDEAACRASELGYRIEADRARQSIRHVEARDV